MASENNCPTSDAVGEAYVAVVTPFTLEGKVDEAALHDYLQVVKAYVHSFSLGMETALGLTIWLICSTCTRAAFGT